MKLKKIASLALAGVMAVSMLAGCSGKGNNSGNNNGNGVVTATGVNADTVIAALTDATTEAVKVTASSELQNELETVVKYLGDSSFSIGDVNDNFSEAAMAYFTGVEYVNGFDFIDEDNYKKAQTVIFTHATSNIVGNDVDDTMSKLAIARDIDVAIDNLQMKENSLNEGEPVEDGDEYYTFNYTAELAVVKISNAAGQTAYVYACTVTCTPSAATVEL